MGFERLTSVLQGKISDYDTDNFLYIIDAISKVNLIYKLLFYDYKVVCRAARIYPNIQDNLEKKIGIV